jgi:hypothetical protein
VHLIFTTSTGNLRHVQPVALNRIAASGPMVIGWIAWVDIGPEARAQFTGFKGYMASIMG